jgi:hypothetical protein
MTDTAGFHFVVSTPAPTLDKHDRKAIRSQATKASVAHRQASKLRSWISPNRELESPKRAILEKPPKPESILSVPSPSRVGTFFSGIQLPPGVEPYMIQDLVKCMHNPPPTHLPLKLNESHIETKPD